jgi:hypothetical protein
MANFVESAKLVPQDWLDLTAKFKSV